jgi:hypothetical protein
LEELHDELLATVGAILPAMTPNHVKQRIRAGTPSFGSLLPVAPDRQYLLSAATAARTAVRTEA